MPVIQVWKEWRSATQYNNEIKRIKKVHQEMEGKESKVWKPKNKK